MITRPQSKSFQRGVSLIEALVSVLILAIGLLGMLAMQGASLRNNQSANERSIAVVASYSIIDAMRANRLAALNGAYNFALSANCVLPQGNTQAVIDLREWVLNLQADLGPTACGNIDCLNGACRVTVAWNDSRATEGLELQQLTTEVRL